MSYNVFHEILQRLDVLEAAVLGRGAATFFDRRLNKGQVGLHEGCSPRTIERGVKKGTFPPPDEIINKRAYWWLSTIERHNRERIRSATQTPPNAGKGRPRGAASVEGAP